jgi:hypothetical protein
VARLLLDERAGERTMRIQRVFLGAGIAMLAATTTWAVPFNVTLNKPATLTGIFGVLRAGSGWAANPVAPAGSIDDGVFAPEQTDWNVNSIWWDASVQGSENNSITINLLGSYHISGIITQADNNDSYNIEYFSPSLGSWQTLGFWGPIGGYGLMTRPNGDQVTPYPISFDASAIRLSAFAGDQYYAYSEFQAYGEPIPEPSTLLLLGAGMLLGGRRLRPRA